MRAIGKNAATAGTGGGAGQFERIETRSAEVGGLPIRRVLPSRARRMVGAWCFFDHLGPVEPPPGGGLHVGPHPHIGLQTFTWVIEGQIVHRDSLGFEQVIRPGEVNLMTAGRGIAHSEDSVDGGTKLHATQLWIALPQAERHREPAFEHQASLPVVELDGMRATVLAGRALGEASPARTYSELVGLELVTRGAAAASLPLAPHFEHAVFVLEGEVDVAGQRLASDVFVYLGSGRESLEVRSRGPSRVMLLGGAPFGEDILLWWNFVARTGEEIEQASVAWNGGLRFGEVRGSPSARLAAPELSGLVLRSTRP